MAATWHPKTPKVVEQFLLAIYIRRSGLWAVCG